MLDLRYPIGPFDSEPAATEAARRACLVQLAEAPSKLRTAIAGLSDSQLDTPYRSGGWTVRQVVHHLGKDGAVRVHSGALSAVGMPKSITPDSNRERPLF